MSRRVVPPLPSLMLAPLLLVILAAPRAWAGPGAHGPNGEHLDAPAVTHPAAAATLAPRLEAVSDDFELVATLHEDELSIFIDRYETNEPVLQARVEVQAGKLTSTARYHADHGDYAVADTALRQALTQPGRHPLVFTLHTGTGTDLLEGVLEVPAEGAVRVEDDHGHGTGHAAHHGPDDERSGGVWKTAGVTASVAGLAALLAAIWRFRRRRTAARAGTVAAPSSADTGHQGANR